MYVAYASGLEQGMSNAAMSINKRSFTVLMAFQPMASKQMANTGAIVPWHIASNFLYADTYGKWQTIHDGSTEVLESDCFLNDSPTLLCWSNGASTTKFRVDDGAIDSGAAMAVGTETTMTFGNFSGLTLGCIGDYIGCVVWNRQLTDAEMETARMWAASYWGCGVAKTHEIICDGDSNMIGGFSSGNNDVEGSIYNPGSQIARMRRNWRVYNYAVGGVTTATNTTNLATQGTLVAANADLSLPTIGLHSNGNDFADTTAAGAITRMTAYTTALGATKQIHCTVPNRITVGFDAYAAAVSALITSTYRHTCDIRSIPELDDVTDTNYYSLDQIHRDENGYCLEAALMVDAIEEAIDGTPSALSLTTFYGPNPAVRNFKIHQGSDWQRGPFTFDIDGVEVDISGNSYLCLGKRNLLDEEAAFEIECTITAEGLMLSFAAADNLAVETGETADSRLSKFYYDVRQTNADGFHDYPLKGRITLHATCSND